MGPVGLMKSTRKQQLFAIKGFFLEFFSQLILTSGDVLKSFDGWGGWVGFLNIVSTPGLGLSRLRLGLVRWMTRLAKARFGKVGDQFSQVKARARARSLTIKTYFLEADVCKIQEIDDVSGVCSFELAAEQQQQLSR